MMFQIVSPHRVSVDLVVIEFFPKGNQLLSNVAARDVEKINEIMCAAIRLEKSGRRGQDGRPAAERVKDALMGAIGKPWPDIDDNLGPPHQLKAGVEWNETEGVYIYVRLDSSFGDASDEFYVQAAEPGQCFRSGHVVEIAF